GAYGVRHWKDADTVNVSSGVSGIDIGVVAVKSGGFASLRGRIDAGGKGVSGVNVFGEAPDGSVLGCALSDNAGAYEIDALPPGVMTIVVDGEGYNSVQQQIVINASDFALTNNFTVSDAASATGTTGADNVPEQFALGQNYPNPFNPTTTITFALPVASTVTVRVFNVLGQQIATLAGGVFGAGSHAVVWDGRDGAGRAMASGVYFYRMDASGLAGGGSYRDMKRMLLLK
ncbi:MAG TPA: FlgD immunoglobulin-like domain containing protein, partial [Bacteroidota bacterium]|nr:FlgD immunoglobulin-like domain containing protein [Bacteroidota bacterium]